MRASGRAGQVGGATCVVDQRTRPRFWAGLARALRRRSLFAVLATARSDDHRPLQHTPDGTRLWLFRLAAPIPTRPARVLALGRRRDGRRPARAARERRVLPPVAPGPRPRPPLVSSRPVPPAKLVAARLDCVQRRRRRQLDRGQPTATVAGLERVVALVVGQRWQRVPRPEHVLLGRRRRRDGDAARHAACPDPARARVLAIDIVPVLPAPIFPVDLRLRTPATTNARGLGPHRARGGRLPRAGSEPRAWAGARRQHPVRAGLGELHARRRGGRGDDGRLGAADRRESPYRRPSPSPVHFPHLHLHLLAQYPHPSPHTLPPAAFAEQRRAAPFRPSVPPPPSCVPPPLQFPPSPLYRTIGVITRFSSTFSLSLPRSSRRPVSRASRTHNPHQRMDPGGCFRIPRRTDLELFPARSKYHKNAPRHHSALPTSGGGGERAMGSPIDAGVTAWGKRESGAGDPR